MPRLSSRTVTKARVFAVIYTTAVVYLCTYPLEFAVHTQPAILDWTPVMGRAGWADVALNLVFYVPLAAASYCALRTRHRWAAALLFCSALTFAVELTQAWLPGRDSSLRDALLNVGGAIAGVAFGPWIEHRAAKLEDRGTQGAVDIGAWILMGAFVLGHIFPGVPSFRLPTLRLAWNGLFETPSLATVVEISLLTASAVALIMQGGRLLPRLYISVAVLGFFLARPVFQASPLSIWELTAAALSVGVTMLAGINRVARPLGILLAGYIVFAQFQPFVFAGSPSRFAWIPFSGLFDLPTAGIVRIYAMKAFLYGSGVYFGRHLGFSLMGSGLLIGAIVTVGEFAQRYLPGRTPESSDILLVGAMTGLLWMSGAQRNEANGGSRSAR